jgi:hypothetical protein
MTSGPTVTVDFTPEDHRRLLATANDRGYGGDRGGRGLADYVRDCALGKFERESGEGEHVRMALLTWNLVTEAWERLGNVDQWETHKLAFRDALREVLADAADEGRLG